MTRSARQAAQAGPECGAQKSGAPTPTAGDSDAKIKADRERRAAQEAVHQQPTARPEQLRAEYLDLLANKTSRQQRGYALERILAELSRLSHLETTEAFRVVGEQVDGAVKFDGEHYLIEAKWQERSASNEPVYQFAKGNGKLYGRGCLFQ